MRWKIGANVCVAALALAAVLLMLNYLGSRHFRRMQWSADPRFQLSPVTREVLRSVTNEVKAIVFFDRTKPLYDLVSDLLNQYQAQCPKLRVEYVDYERSPARARTVQVDYALAPAAEGDRVIFDNGGKRRVVYAREMSEFDYGALLKGKEAKRTGFKGEQLFTSAIFSLVEARPLKVYFLQGHGEHDPAQEDDDMGFSKFATMLQESQIAVAKLGPTALVAEDVPADCQLLIVANAVTALQREELERIEKYLGLGGRLMVLFNWSSAKQTTGLEQLLASWGVEVGRNFVTEAPPGKPPEARKIILTHFANHPIVSPLLRSRLLLIVPRSIAALGKNPQSADAPKVIELATTSDDGQAWQASSGRADRRGPIPLMVAVEKGAIQGISGDRGAARIVVAGDSYFLANAGIEFDANRDFGRNAVNWLLSRDLLVQGIGTRSVKEYRIVMTAAEFTRIRWAFLVGFPGAALFVGFVVWLRRRA